MQKLSAEFYERQDVLTVARELIGKILVTQFDSTVTAGKIVETEAYAAFVDKASHSFDGRRTARNEHMYAQAGTTYVYICYGMHHLFNIVTNKKNIPDAVLIRAIEPLQGVDIMLKRTGKKGVDASLTKGPGNVSKALGISKNHSGLHVTGDIISVFADETFNDYNHHIGISKRIGIDGAAEAVLYPYRFYVRGNKFVSGYPNK